MTWIPTLALGLLLAAGGSTAALADDDQKKADDARRTTAMERPVVGTVAPGVIAAEPAAYYGKTYAVKGEVEETMNPHVFTLDEDRLFAGPDVMVLVPRPTASPMEGEVVTVTGTVRPFVRAELERDYDWLDLDWFASDDLIVKLESRPVVVADKVVTSRGVDLAADLSDAPANVEPSKVTATSGVRTVEAGDIAATPMQYAGTKVRVTSEVEEKLSQQVFTLDEDHLLASPDVLVVAPRPVGTVEEGETVTVVGTVRPFVRAELERDYDWFRSGFAVTTTLQDLDRRPVLIAESIRTSSGQDLLAGNTTSR